MNKLKQSLSSLLHAAYTHSPFILGIAGSVAVGKSTLGLDLQTLLCGWPEKPTVSLISTDGFLYPSAVLKERGLMHKKGFPESYDHQRLVDFFKAIHAGEQAIQVPQYSHQTYDILDEPLTLSSPDILIIEGVNILEYAEYLDYTIFIDAPTPLIKSWFLERYQNFLKEAINNPSSFFYPYTLMPPEQALQRALDVWENINEPNLVQHILPFKHRANLILKKGEGHFLSICE